MWDRTALMNAAASALYGVGVLLALYLAWALAARLPAFALREVRIDSGLKHVTRSQIEEVVRRELKGNLLTVDLAATRAAFEQLPWVRSVSVRRAWPSALGIAFEEHVPLARWGNAALVNTQGEVFRAAFDGELPVFIGPEGAAREIAIQYRYFLRSLEAIGEKPVQVRVTPRRAWQLRLQSGLIVELGREQVEARLARFVAAHERTIGRFGRPIDRVDLRYSSGFAVRISEPLREKAPKRGRRAG